MAHPEGLLLEISIDCKGWVSALPDYEKLCKISLEQIIKNVPKGAALSKFAHIELSVVLCNDALIHELNNDFRRKDQATNVLSFPGLDDDQINNYLCANEDVPKFPHSLGEIYIAFETMQKEATKAGITLQDHFLHLVSHGILHLLGFDHIKNEEAEIMEALETKILYNLGIGDPYRA
jgi:probable rRNA maturation factor